MGGQHRWAPAFLAARHHIYFFHLLLYMSYLANKIVVVVVDRSPYKTCESALMKKTQNKRYMFHLFMPCSSSGLVEPLYIVPYIWRCGRCDHLKSFDSWPRKCTWYVTHTTVHHSKKQNGNWQNSKWKSLTSLLVILFFLVLILHWEICSCLLENCNFLSPTFNPWRRCIVSRLCTLLLACLKLWWWCLLYITSFKDLMTTHRAEY